MFTLGLKLKTFVILSAVVSIVMFPLYRDQVTSVSAMALYVSVPAFVALGYYLIGCMFRAYDAIRG